MIFVKNCHIQDLVLLGGFAFQWLLDYGNPHDVTTHDLTHKQIGILLARGLLVAAGSRHRARFIFFFNCMFWRCFNRVESGMGKHAGLNLKSFIARFTKWSLFCCFARVWCGLFGLYIYCHVFRDLFAYILPFIYSYLFYCFR